MVDISGHQRKMRFIEKEGKQNNEMNHCLSIFEIDTQAARQKKKIQIYDLSDD